MGRTPEPDLQRSCSNSTIKKVSGKYRAHAQGQADCSKDPSLELPGTHTKQLLYDSSSVTSELQSRKAKLKPCQQVLDQRPKTENTLLLPWCFSNSRGALCWSQRHSNPKLTPVEQKHQHSVCCAKNLSLCVLFKMFYSEVVLNSTMISALFCYSTISNLCFPKAFPTASIPFALLLSQILLYHCYHIKNTLISYHLETLY